MTRWSRYKHVISGVQENDNYVAVWNALNMEVVFMNKEAYEILDKKITNNLCSEILDEEKAYIKILTEKELLVSEDYNEEGIRNDIGGKFAKVEPTTLRLLLTDVCNLNCTYCQIEKNYTTNYQKSMSIEIAKKSLECFSRFAPKDKEKTIILTGGEPLLNIETIKWILESASQYIENYRVILFTNGVQMTEELAQLFKKYNVLVLISIDGHSENHNKVRKDMNNSGSYEKVYKGYEICKKVGCKLGISAVAGTHNIDTLDGKDIEFLLDLEPASIGINFPHYLLNEENETLIGMDQYTKKLVKIFEKCRDKDVYLENISRVILPFTERRLRGKECAALGRGITVGSSGDVGPCKTLMVADIVKTNIDELVKAESLDQIDMFREWGERSTFTLESCKGCECIALCGTGCTYDSYVVNHDIKGIDSRACELTKSFMLYSLKTLFDIVSEKHVGETMLIPQEEDYKAIVNNMTLDNLQLIRSAGHDREEDILAERQK